MQLNITNPIIFNTKTQVLFEELAKLVSLSDDDTDFDKHAAIESILNEWGNTPNTKYLLVKRAADGWAGQFAAPGCDKNDVEQALFYAFKDGKLKFEPGIDASCIIIRTPHDGKDWWVAHTTMGEVRAYGDSNNAVEIGNSVIETSKLHNIKLLPSQEAAVSAEYNNRIKGCCSDDFRFYPPFLVNDNNHLALIKADPETNYPLYAVPFISVGLPYQVIKAINQDEEPKDEYFFVFDDPTRKDASIFRATIKFDAEGNFIVGKGEQAAFYMCVEYGGEKYVYPVHSNSTSQGIVTVACPELCRMFSKANAERNQFLGIGTEAATAKPGVGI